MPPQGRVGDKSLAPVCAHGCPLCPHPMCSGPATQGSSDVIVGNKPALRLGDKGVHMACCGSNTWEAVQGSATVLINNKGAHRLGDQDKHCGGVGTLIEGEFTVLVGG